MHKIGIIAIYKNHYLERKSIKSNLVVRRRTSPSRQIVQSAGQIRFVLFNLGLQFLFDPAQVGQLVLHLFQMGLHLLDGVVLFRHVQLEVRQLLGQEVHGLQALGLVAPGGDESDLLVLQLVAEPLVVREGPFSLFLGG